MIRGLNKSKIFRDSEDKGGFLERLGMLAGAGKCSVYAWAVMDNHVHILFKSGEHGISGTMRKLLTWYAQYYNRRHHRRGHLFENRYKSILCEEDNYLLALVRYIHMNPVRAGIVSTLSELERYSWSGHSTIMGNADRDWMDTAYVLRQFGSRRKSAGSAYHQFVSEGMTMGKVPELSGGGLIRSKGGWSEVLSARRLGLKEESDERIPGSGDFVNAILEEAEQKAIRQMKLRRSGLTIDSIIEEECRKEETSTKELMSGSRRRKVTALRAKIAKRGLDELGLALAELARHLGVNTSSIAKAIGRAEKTA